MLVLRAGLAADVGTLQRLPAVIGSRSLVNELCLTARRLGSQEALQCGLVSRVLSDRHRSDKQTGTGQTDGQMAVQSR